MSGPPPGLGLDGLEQAKMPTSKANTGSFKRNSASARRFLETLKDSCSSNPTTVSFFMALITSWKARRYVLCYLYTAPILTDVPLPHPADCRQRTS